MFCKCYLETINIFLFNLASIRKNINKQCEVKICIIIDISGSKMKQVSDQTHKNFGYNCPW